MTEKHAGFPDAHLALGCAAVQPDCLLLATLALMSVISKCYKNTFKKSSPEVITLVVLT